MGTLQGTFKEVVISTVPIALIVVILQLILVKPSLSDMALFLGCIVLVLIGFTVFLYGVDSAKQVRLSVSGCYAPSREALVREWRPAFLPDGLPWMHPEGFPMAQMFELPDDAGKKSS